jgi:hypothetical protein
MMFICARLGIAAARQDEASPKAAPDGWFVYPIHDPSRLERQARDCFNYSRDTWQVSLQQGAAKIVKFDRRSAEQPPMPPLLKVMRNAMRGHKTLVKFADSWLLGIDGGEFGGGLWVSSLDGSETRQVWDKDVKSIIPVRDKILVLSGLAHMIFDSGDALVLSQPHGLEVNVERRINLDGEPRAYTMDAGGSVLIVTTRSLSRITEAWQLERLLFLPDFMRLQYANSIIQEPDGTIYIGMRMLVLRLLPPEYKEEWLLPDECRKVYVSGTDCTCRQ